MCLNLDCPCLSLVKAVATEKARGQGVVYIFNYARAIGKTLEKSLVIP